MSRIGGFIKKLYYNKIVRFLFVGCLNTVVGVGVTYLVYIAAGKPIFKPAVISAGLKFAATLAGQVVGTIHSYFWNKYFTFKSKEKSKKEFLRFVLVYAVQYGINYGLTLLLSRFINVAWLYTIIVTFICTAVSFVGHNFFSFKKQGNFGENKKNDENEISSDVKAEGDCLMQNEKVDKED